RLAWLAAALVAAALIGLAALWPRGAAPDLAGSASRLAMVDATVTEVGEGECLSGEVDAPVDCQLVRAEVTSGPGEGDLAEVRIPRIDFSAPTLAVGDKVVLLRNAAAPASFRYSWVDFQRRTPLLLLTGLFAVVVVGVGRLQGLRALGGLVVSLGVVGAFLLPALLRGENALAAGLVTTVLVGAGALYLAHGVNPASTVALLGALAGVLVIAGLGAVFIAAARLTGLSDDSAQILRVTAQAIDARGLLLAGAVVGALGVLDDVTVTQVSAVLELRRADPGLRGRALYRAALRIGRDHVASTVNTLVLAYVGVSLPLLVFFHQAGQPLGRVFTREVVAVEIVRMLVGSIGLVLAVPFTTAIAAAVLAPEPDPGGSWPSFAPEAKPF
ncbi:MAG: YibE/F family protein, partial [Acidimicrobiales bacterium]